MTGRTIPRPDQGTATDQGAILILVLVVVTIMSVATAAVVGFGFSGGRAATTQVARDRLVDALGSGIDAAIENTRVGAGHPCDGSPLVLPDVDDAGRPTEGAASAPLTVVVTCTPEDAGAAEFLATGYLAQDCPDPGSAGPTSQSTTLAVVVTFAAGGSPVVQSRTQLTGPQCEQVPGGS